MNKNTNVKFEEIPDFIEDLKGVSGLYIFHTKRHIWYIGKTECFRNRFVNGYLKGRRAKQHVHEGLLQRIEPGLELSVVFSVMDKELLKNEELRVIGKACPWLNTKYNPRWSIGAIQRHIGLIINNSPREWTYEEIMRHLFFYYSGQIATKRIEEALTNKNSKLSLYCEPVSLQRILKPKKESA
ncbi:hypothetical protein [Fictibacillus fluitans]|uniref:GIY-YIG domain-containing protein n=1 Tax=Fictibacillus fluitans TaxID=3058422 RepID=A0ABT8HUF5_9BACL|nr:hypothetical protein [Fictibacillus sp. NE201]MDN4524399.1 hypothetical protein [Fictibacillus sp. NE201]